jgi:hypothetical protein
MTLLLNIGIMGFHSVIASIQAAALTPQDDGSACLTIFPFVIPSIDGSKVHFRKLRIAL